MGNQNSAATDFDDFDDSAVEARLEAFNRKLEIRRQSEAFSKTPDVNAGRRQRNSNSASAAPEAQADAGRRAFERRHSKVLLPLTSHSVDLPGDEKEERGPPRPIRRARPKSVSSDEGATTASSNRSRLQLDAAQIGALRNAWAFARTKGQGEPGSTFFALLFASSAELKAQFAFSASSEGGGSGEEWERRLAGHAATFGNFLDALLGRLEDEADPINIDFVIER